MKNCRISIAILVLDVLTEVLMGAPTTQPNKQEEVTGPKLFDAVTIPNLSEAVTIPKVSETVTRPKLPEAMIGSKLSETVTRPKLSEAVTRPKLSETVTRPKLFEAVTRPKLPEAVTKPMLSEAVTRPKLSETVTRPKLSEAVTRPRLSETVTRPDRSHGVTQSHSTGSPHKKEDEDKVEQFLKTYGYMRMGVSKNSFRYENEQKNAIMRVQKFYKLNITGELDGETIEVMNASRCGLPDITINSIGINKRYVVYSRWGHKSLTYKVDNYPSVSNGFSNRYQLDATIRKAFKHWSDSSGLKISEGRHSSDITLGFYSGDHGDSKKFDGPRGTLGHAFFPKDGRIHLDNDETWSSGQNGYNLEQVLTHEAGHALGLEHTNDPNAIMFPTYKFKTNFSLGEDDIRGIQALYGPSRSPRKTTTTSTSSSPSVTNSTTTATTTKSAITTTRMPFWKRYMLWRESQMKRISEK